MLKSPVPQSFDHRIQVEVEKWRKHALLPEEKKPATMRAPFVTISRQYGAPGHILGRTLGERLNQEAKDHEFVVYDQNLLQWISDHEDVAIDLVQSLTNHTRSVIEDWIIGLLSGQPSELSTFHHLARAVNAIAARGHAILVGRGSSIIARNNPNGIFVRLVAPVEWRINYLKQIYPERANEFTPDLVERTDKEREAFVRKYIGLDLREPVHYHIVLNAARVTLEEQVDIVSQMVHTLCKKNHL